MGNWTYRTMRVLLIWYERCIFRKRVLLYLKKSNQGNGQALPMPQFSNRKIAEASLCMGHGKEKMQRKVLSGCKINVY